MRWLLIGAAAVLVLAALRFTLFRPRPIEVDVAKVQRGMVEDAVTNSQAGTVKSRRRARVGAERAGLVAAIPHREGSAVRRGAVLVQLDASSARVQLDLSQRDRDALRAGLESARAGAVLARQEFERAERLHAQGVLAQEQMDLARSKRDGAEAELKAAEARLERADSAVRLAQNELAHLRVTAPFDGVVTTRMVEVGESVIPGQPVLEVTSLDDLYVSAPIDEIDIGRLKTGLPARVTLDPHPGRDLARRGLAASRRWSTTSRSRTARSRSRSRSRTSPTGRSPSRAARPTCRSSSTATTRCCACPPSPLPRAGASW